MLGDADVPSTKRCAICNTYYKIVIFEDRPTGPVDNPSQTWAYCRPCWDYMEKLRRFNVALDGQTGRDENPA